MGKTLRNVSYSAVTKIRLVGRLIYIVYFAINAARQNKNTNRHTVTQYTNIKLQPIQRIKTIY